MNIIINALYEYVKWPPTSASNISRGKFHCRQYSSPVLFNVDTIEVSAAIGGSGGDVIDAVTIDDVAIRLLWTKQHNIQQWTISSRWRKTEHRTDFFL